MPEDLFDELLSAVNHDVFRASRDPLTLQHYTGDFSATRNRRAPHAVVYPETVEEVSSLLRFARRRAVPVVPYSAGTGLGTWMAQDGGIIVDLRRMNRIVEINEDELYVVVEPGVTYSQLTRELVERGLVISIPDSTPSASVLANHVNFGIGAYIQEHGLGQELVCGLEVALPDGDVVRTGSAALPHASWSVRTTVFAPIPDLTGLFLNSLGTLGIVTKVAIRVFPVPEEVRYLKMGFGSIEVGASAARQLARESIAQRVVGFNWFFSPEVRNELAGHITGDPMTAEDLHALRSGVDCPEIYFFLGMHGSKDEVRLRERRLRDVAASHDGVEMEMDELATEKYYSVARGSPQTVSLRQILAKKGKYRGGYDTVYTYCPFGRWADLYEAWMAVGLEYGHPLAMNAKVLPLGRVSTFRFILSYFNNDDQADVERIDELKGRLVDIALEQGALTGSFPKKRMPELASYGLYQRVREALDPVGIMHPTHSGRGPVMPGTPSGVDPPAARDGPPPPVPDTTESAHPDDGRPDSSDPTATEE